MADRDQAANGPPDITVVVPVKNRRVMVPDLLHGLRQQTLRSAGFELLVLDNQSQDDIEALVRDFATACRSPSDTNVSTGRGISSLWGA